MPCSPLKVNRCFGETYAKQDTSVKAGGKLSNQLDEHFGLYRKQEGNRRVDLSSHRLTVGQNETIGLSHYHLANQ
jgi:hypothetical protein